jgi:hypothetical protein
MQNVLALIRLGSQMEGQNINSGSIERSAAMSVSGFAGGKTVGGRERRRPGRQVGLGGPTGEILVYCANRRVGCTAGKPGLHSGSSAHKHASDSESTPRVHPGWSKGIRIGSLKDGKVTIFIPGHKTDSPVLCFALIARGRSHTGAPHFDSGNRTLRSDSRFPPGFDSTGPESAR